MNPINPQAMDAIREAAAYLSTLRIGQPVRKVGGDYKFDGVVVSVFWKLGGAVRFVVEDDRGILHIFSEKNLEAR